MLHQCCRWTSRYPGDLATRAHRVSIQRAGDPLQPAEDDRGFLEPGAPWRRQLFLYRPDARILSLTLRLVPSKGSPRSRASARPGHAKCARLPARSRPNAPPIDLRAAGRGTRAGASRLDLAPCVDAASTKTDGGNRVTARLKDQSLGYRSTRRIAGFCRGASRHPGNDVADRRHGSLSWPTGLVAQPLGVVAFLRPGNCIEITTSANRLCRPRRKEPACERPSVSLYWPEHLQRQQSVDVLLSLGRRVWSGCIADRHRAWPKRVPLIFLPVDGDGQGPT